MKKILVIILISISSSLSAESILFEYSGSKIQIMDKAVTRINKLLEDDSGIEEKHLVSFSSGVFKGFDLYLNHGPSGDPSFYFKSGTKSISIWSGDDIKIISDGHIYVTSRSNEFFSVTNKFFLKSNAVIRLVQPFKYAGFRSVSNKEFNIYSDKENTVVLEKIKANAKVEVVLCEKEMNCLIRSVNNLVGWRKIRMSEAYLPLEKNLIKGFYYQGD